MRFCTVCGTQLTRTGKFCPGCGAQYEEPAAENQAQAYDSGDGISQGGASGLSYAQAEAPPAAVPARERNKRRAPLVIGVSICLVAALSAMLYGILGRGDEDVEIRYSYLSREAEPHVEYAVTETIFPSLYRNLDAVVTFVGSCEGEGKDVIIELEIPGFTQKYTQKVSLGQQITKLNIKPPLLTGQIDLGTEKDAQLAFSVKEAESGKIIAQDSKRVTLKSKYDVIWWTEEFGDMNNDNILAWMTPESPGVLQLKRSAVDYLAYVSDGTLNSIVGYQNYGFDDPSTNTWVQAIAIQGAMGDVEGVRYNNAAFSISSDVHQRVMLPDDVIESKSGICIETALLMASALQSAGMHPMLIFPPGHAQVAVECWPSTGEYFLIETTILPMPMNDSGFSSAVTYLTKDQWQGYIDGTGEYTLGQCYVLDCDLGKKLGILPMSN